MRLAKIKNRYMFNSKNPNGNHTYAVYYDKATKSYRAVQLTHLYIKDDVRFKQVKRGNIMVEKFNEFSVPSGVRNEFYYKNSTGGKINLKHKDVIDITNRHLSSKQSQRIINFAKKPHK